VYWKDTETAVGMFLPILTDCVSFLRCRWQRTPETALT